MATATTCSSSSSSNTPASRSALKELVAVVGQFLEFGYSLLPFDVAACGGATEREVERACDELLAAAAPEAELAPIAHPQLFECMRFVAPDAGFHHVRANVAPKYHAFFAVQIPGIALRAYAERVMHYMRCSPEAYIVALVLMHRAARAGLPVTLRSAHRLFVAALVLAVKMVDDQYYQMSYYAQVSGLPLGELVTLEMTLAGALGFALHTTAGQYASMVFALRCFVEQGAERLGLSWAHVAATLAMPRSAVTATAEEIDAICGASSSSSTVLMQPLTEMVVATAAPAAATPRRGGCCCELSRVLSDDGLSLFSPHSSNSQSLILSDAGQMTPPLGAGDAATATSSLFPAPVYAPRLAC